MFYRFLDKNHPAYDEQQAAEFGPVIPRTYEDMDKVLQMCLEKVDGQTAVIVMSDHGFNPFRWGFNLNTWLLQTGYHHLLSGSRPEEVTLFQQTDWSRTKAYGVGLNALYLNLKGREAQGIVPLSERDSLTRQLAEQLEQLVDPRTGEK